jgi:hypothetical protein
MVPPDRIVHPIAPGVAAEQDNLEQLSRPEAGLGTMRDRSREAFLDDADHELQLAPFALG